MNTPDNIIRLGGALHFLILVASAMVPHVLDWRGQLAGLHPFMRRLFWVYGVFIVLTIVGFGAISISCAGEIATGSPLARAFCWFVTVFWAARQLVQWLVFDARPFLTNWFFKAGYHGLNVVFLSLVGIYAWAAAR